MYTLLIFSQIFCSLFKSEFCPSERVDSFLTLQSLCVIFYVWESNYTYKSLHGSVSMHIYEYRYVLMHLIGIVPESYHFSALPWYVPAVSVQTHLYMLLEKHESWPTVGLWVCPRISDNHYSNPRGANVVGNTYVKLFLPGSRTQFTETTRRLSADFQGILG